MNGNNVNDSELDSAVICLTVVIHGNLGREFPTVASRDVPRTGLSDVAIG